MQPYAVAQIGRSYLDWTQDFAPGKATAPVPFWDTVTRGFDDQRKTQNNLSVAEAYDAQVGEMQRRYRAATGKVLDKQATGLTYSPDGFDYGTLSDDDYNAWVAQQRGSDPSLDFLKTTGELKAAVTANLAPVRLAADLASEQHPVAGFAGHIAGSFTDPLNLYFMAATGPLGVEGTGAKVIAGRILLQGALGGAQAGLEAPGKMASAERYGGPAYGADEARSDILGGVIGSAGLEALGIGAARGIKYLWRTHVKARVSADPSVRGAAQTLDIAALDTMASGHTAMAGEADEGAHALATGAPRPQIEPEKDLGELFANPVKTVTEGRSVAPGGQGLSETEYQGRPIYSGQFDPAALETDAAKFQYKADGDAQGVTQRLQGIQSWDPASSGKALIWEDAAGKRFVADGHQRLGLAKRLVKQGFEDKPMLDGYLFRASEGWTSQDVRVVAALKNIREGSGTILDAAKVFRDAPGSAADRSLPVTGEFIQQARTLARLEPEAFGAVVNKVIPERYAAEIGAIAGDRPDLHMPMVRLMKEAEPASIDEARALVQEALLDEAITAEGTQADLFGGVAPQMTTIARAKVKASVLGQLKRDARIYTQLVKNADIIEAGGNALARTDNERRLSLDLAAAEIVNRLSLRSGPVGEQFATAARRVAEGARAGDVSKAITATIKKAIADGELDGLAREVALAPPAPGPAVEVDPKLQIEAKPEDAAFEGQSGGFELTEKAPTKIDKGQFTVTPRNPEIRNAPNKGLTGINGTISADGKIWQVGQAGLPDMARGRGIGLEMYAEAAQRAEEAGAQLQSDKEVSKSAAAVWQRLGDKGFEIEKNPDAKFTEDPTHHDGGFWSAPGWVYRVLDHQQGGLFDDLLADRSLQSGHFEAAIKRLAPCSPGGV